MSFKDKYNYILKNTVDITIYDRIRELIKEFGEEDYNYPYVCDGCDDEKKFHISNRENIKTELKHINVIQDEISDLLEMVSRRRDKLIKIKDYTDYRVIINDDIYRKIEYANNDIHFCNDDCSLSIYSKAILCSLNNKEHLYNIQLGKKVKGEIFYIRIDLNGEFTYEQVDKLIKYYVIDKKLIVDSNSYKSIQSRRDINAELLLNL